MTCINPYLIKFPPFSAILALWGRTHGRMDKRTDRPTERQTDRRTDKASYRDAWMHLKRKKRNVLSLGNLHFIRVAFVVSFLVLQSFQTQKPCGRWKELEKIFLAFFERTF